MLMLNMKKQLQHFTIQLQLESKDDILILFGPSGSGKTTVLNCIAGLDVPDDGLIKFNEQTFFEKNRGVMPIQKRKLGYLFQDFALFPHMTVEKNITYAMKSQSLVDHLVQVIGIEHLLKKYPRQISGGEKQRVALARALSTEPQLLLLDEPFSSLDQFTKNVCYEELKRLHQLWKIPIIMVTHDYEEAKILGNRILYMKYGKLQEMEYLNQ